MLSLRSVADVCFYWGKRPLAAEGALLLLIDVQMWSVEVLHNGLTAAVPLHMR